MGAKPGRYQVQFDTDGSGEWRVNLPADCTWEDLEDLAPVIDSMRTFLEPTVDGVSLSSRNA